MHAFSSAVHERDEPVLTGAAAAAAAAAGGGARKSNETPKYQLGVSRLEMRDLANHKRYQQLIVNEQ